MGNNKRGKRPIQKPKSGQQLCGTCSRDPGDNPIGCDSCEVWVHSTEMCSGLPSDLIHAILDYGGEGIRFICMRCRLKPPSTSDDAEDAANTAQSQSHLIGTMQQMFQQFRGMCQMISEVSDELRNLARSMKPQTQNAIQPPEPPRLPHAPTPQPTEQPALRSVIVEEVREMQEREKRKHSIIIKGLNTSSTAEASRLFREISSSKFGCEVFLTEVSSIKDHAGMFRAKITSDEQRKQVLNSAKTLKGTQYDKVYISRDLTRAQRTALFEKRQARRSQNPMTTDPAPSSLEAHDSARAGPAHASADTIPKAVAATPQVSGTDSGALQSTTQGN